MNTPTWVADLTGRDAWIVGALAATVAVLLVALVRAVRRGRVDRWVDRLAGFAVLALLAEGMWEVATQTLHLAPVFAAATFFVFEAAMVSSALRANRHQKLHGHPGRHAIVVWAIAISAGLIVASNATTVVEALLRLALPVMAAALWWVGLTAEGTARPKGRLRWTPSRLLEWLGAIEPDTERDLAQVDRLRRVAAMTRAARRVHAGRRLAGWHLARLERLALAADDAMVAEVRCRVERVHRIVELTRPAATWPATEVATDADKQADTTTATGPAMAVAIRRPSARTSARTAKASDTATRVAKLLARTPDTDAATIAVRLAVSERTVRRHLAAMATATGPASVNGHNFTEGRVS